MMRTVIVITIIMIIASMSFGFTSPNHKHVAFARTATNGKTEWKTAFYDPLDSLAAAQHRVTKGRVNIADENHLPYEDNISIGYSSTFNATQLGATKNVSWGRFFISGFVPALETNISLDFKSIDQGFYNPNFWFEWMGWKAGADNLRNKLEFYIYYYDSSGIQHSYAHLSPTYGYGGIPWITMMFHWSPNGTVNIQFYNTSTPGDVLWSKWLFTYENKYFDEQPAMTPGYYCLYWTPGVNSEAETYYYLYVKNLTQTVPIAAADVYSDLPTHTYTGLGFDHFFSITYQNLFVSGILDGLGVKATWFADRAYEENGPYLKYNQVKWNESQLADILEHGHEIGVHFSFTDPMDEYDQDGIDEIDGHYSYLMNMANDHGWNDGSITWTNYQARYNPEYNDYAWNTYHIVGKKFWAHPFNNMGLWEDEYFNLTLWLAEAGASFCGVAHIVDYEWPDRQPQGISMKHFLDIVQAFQAKDVKIVGMMEYWSRYAAPWFVSGTIDNTSEYNKSVTIEYSALKLNSPFEVHVSLAAMGLSVSSGFELKDQNWNSVNYTYDNGYVVFDAHDGGAYYFLISDASDIYILSNVVIFTATIVLICTLIMLIRRAVKS